MSLLVCSALSCRLYVHTDCMPGGSAYRMLSLPGAVSSLHAPVVFTYTSDHSSSPLYSNIPKLFSSPLQVLSPCCLGVSAWLAHATSPPSDVETAQLAVVM